MHRKKIYYEFEKTNIRRLCARKSTCLFLLVKLSEGVTKCSSLCTILPPQFKATESKQTKAQLHPAWLPTLSLQVNSCPTHTEH